MLDRSGSSAARKLSANRTLGDVTLERVLQLIKGGYSREFGLEFGPKEIWQRGFTDHRIRDTGDYERHRNYIHQNPMERGLVAIAGDYRLSSAYPGFKLDERNLSG